MKMKTIATIVYRTVDGTTKTAEASFKTDKDPRSVSQSEFESIASNAELPRGALVERISIGGRDFDERYADIRRENENVARWVRIDDRNIITSGPYLGLEVGLWRPAVAHSNAELQRTPGARLFAPNPATEWPAVPLDSRDLNRIFTYDGSPFGDALLRYIKEDVKSADSSPFFQALFSRIDPSARLEDLVFEGHRNADGSLWLKVDFPTTQAGERGAGWLSWDPETGRFNRSDSDYLALGRDQFESLGQLIERLCVPQETYPVRAQGDEI
jgi:hypothetical protein